MLVASGYESVASASDQVSRPSSDQSEQGKKDPLFPVPTWVLLLPFGLSFALGVWTLPHQPARVPVHWGPSGQPDRWGSPVEGLFVMPGILLFASLLVSAAAHAQPGAGPFMRMIILSLGLIALGDTAAQAFDWDNFRAGMIGLGLLFMLTGPALGRAEPGTLAGPKLSPVTLRRLGTAWSVYGAAVILASLFAPEAEWITATVLFGLAGVALFVLVTSRRERQDTTH